MRAGQRAAQEKVFTSNRKLLKESRRRWLRVRHVQEGEHIQFMTLAAAEMTWRGTSPVVIPGNRELDACAEGFRHRVCLHHGRLHSCTSRNGERPSVRRLATAQARRVCWPEWGADGGRHLTPCRRRARSTVLYHYHYRRHRQTSKRTRHASELRHCRQRFLMGNFASYSAGGAAKVSSVLRGASGIQIKFLIHVAGENLEALKTIAFADKLTSIST